MILLHLTRTVPERPGGRYPIYPVKRQGSHSTSCAAKPLISHTPPPDLVRLTGPAARREQPREAEPVVSVSTNYKPGRGGIRARGDRPGGPHNRARGAARNGHEGPHEPSGFRGRGLVSGWCLMQGRMVSVRSGDRGNHSRIWPGSSPSPGAGGPRAPPISVRFGLSSRRFSGTRLLLHR